MGQWEFLGERNNVSGSGYPSTGTVFLLLRGERSVEEGQGAALATARGKEGRKEEKIGAL